MIVYILKMRLHCSLETATPGTKLVNVTIAVDLSPNQKPKHRSALSCVICLLEFTLAGSAKVSGTEYGDKVQACVTPLPFHSNELLSPTTHQSGIHTWMLGRLGRMHLINLTYTICTSFFLSSSHSHGLQFLILSPTASSQRPPLFEELPGPPRYQRH